MSEETLRRTLKRAGFELAGSAGAAESLYFATASEEERGEPVTEASMSWAAHNVAEHLARLAGELEEAARPYFDKGGEV